MDELSIQVDTHTIALDAPLTLEELGLLDDCERDITEGLADFLRVGRALMTIADGQLYRNDYQTFEEYCRKRWDLARRTAYQKIQAAKTYENVRNYAHFPPQNEHQVMQLAPLPTKLQQQAWKQVVDNYQGEPHAITARQVRAVVRELQPPPARGKTLVEQLIADRTFLGIPWQWTVCEMKKASDTQKMSYVWLPLPTSKTEDGNQANCASGTPLVLVNPFTDLFGHTRSAPSPSFLKLCAFVETALQYRFLIWTAHPERIPEMNWPQNAELVVRISRQNDLQLLTDRLGGAPAIQSLWLRPQEALSLPAPLPFTRVLIGDAHWEHNRTPDELLACRRLVGRVLCGTPIVHLAKAIQPALLGYS